MTQPDPQPYELAHLITGVSRRLEAEIEERLRPEGVPIDQYRILRTLTSRDGQAMGELADAVLVDSPTLTKIVDRMVSNALVYRAPEPKDRRKVLIFLSTKGKALQARLTGLVEIPSRGLAGRLGGKETEMLTSLLTRLMRPA
ncbi:transcriptional regulator [Aureimonas sp. SA4125]|uniref:MarR family winged helix-turn-helix transcriptional regulator n=1 Tax=Aureimonas sp. SA4125 TaxID=2826993 RepID=UPI001CC7D1CB|nr:MarR family transcriptional regulator [Aureimonas sp. SA4125]BDA85193.1 transcriptional regulator [Aureimonas sp. SA4125]